MDRRSFLSLVAGYIAWPTTAHAVSRPPVASRRLRLVNAHTGETFDGAYRGDQGPIETAISEPCIFFRDHHSEQKTQMDLGVIDFLADVLDAVGETKATILSAYRSAETNAMLARTNFGVAEHSQHILGRALDFRLDSGLSDAMTKARAMQRGGVGWYPHSGFIHIDTGPVRNWTLDERGLDNLVILDNRKPRLEGTSRALLGRSWRPLRRHSNSLSSTSLPGPSFWDARAVFGSTRNRLTGQLPGLCLTPVRASPSTLGIQVHLEARRRCARLWPSSGAAMHGCRPVDRQHHPVVRRLTEQVALRTAIAVKS